MNLDVKLILEWQKSPIAFIRDMWKFIPERDNTIFQKRKNLTGQQQDILLAVEKAVRDEAPRKISIRSGHGVGKAQPHDLIIDTPKGKRRFGDLKVGDFVFGKNGLPIKISAIYEQGIKKVYRVMFNDRSFTETCGEHLWSVQDRTYNRLKKEPTWHTVTTEDIIRNGIRRKNGAAMARRYKIPSVDSVIYPFKWVSVGSYTLGAWLGDGSYNYPKITSMDREVIQKIESEGYKVTKKKKSPSHEHLNKADEYWIYNVGRDLKSLGLLGTKTVNKFVPDVYKYNIPEIRAEVLRGLLDTDGFVSKEGLIQFTSISKQLSKDVAWLARSLGGRAGYYHKKQPFYKNRNGIKIMGSQAYTTTVTMPADFHPCYIKRKQDRVRKTTQERYLHRWMESIEEIGEKECRCIVVESIDSLYVANDFIVTHNSSTLSWLMLWFLFCFKDSQVACTAPSSDQMFDVLFKEVSKWINEMPKEIQPLYEWQTTHVRMRENPNVWFARAKTGRKESPEALSGIHGTVMLLIDEASGVPDEIFNTAEGSLTQKDSLVIMASNPTRLTGYFYETHHGEKERWQSLHFNSLDSPLVDNEFVESIKAKHGEDSDEFRIRVLGDFPRADKVDTKGYVPLLFESDIRQIPDSGRLVNTRMGVDPSGEGRDLTTWVVRDAFRAKVVGTEKISSPKSIAQKTLTLMSHYEVAPDDVTIDAFGIGHNISQELALAEVKRVRVRAVNVGEKADDSERFINRRAEAFVRLKDWLRSGGELIRDEGWKELLDIRYRSELSGKFKIMSKDEMKHDYGVSSPGVADALSLTFVSSYGGGSGYSRAKSLSGQEVRDMTKVY